MQKIEFGAALDLIQRKDTRYDRDAYLFLRDALDFTIKLRKKSKEGTGHVNGPQLLDGIRLYALKQFGPMVVTVFHYWGIARGDDFGEMVFNLIEAGSFGKSETDSIEDFKGGYDFHDAFVAPFLPEEPVAHPRLRTGAAAGKLR